MKTRALTLIAVCMVSAFVWFGVIVLAIALSDWLAPITFLLLIAALFGFAFRAILDREAHR